jgi:hypothetical protein
MKMDIDPSDLNQPSCDIDIVGSYQLVHASIPNTGDVCVCERKNKIKSCFDWA